MVPSVTRIQSPLNFISVFFVISLLFTVKGCYPNAQSPSWWTAPSRLSAAAYSTYSQLPSIAGGRPLHPQPEDALCCCHRDSPNMEKWSIFIYQICWYVICMNFLESNCLIYAVTVLLHRILQYCKNVHSLMLSAGWSSMFYSVCTIRL
jgi:hypothetical protein